MVTGSVAIATESSATCSHEQNTTMISQERPSQDDEIFLGLCNGAQAGVGAEYLDYMRAFVINDCSLTRPAVFFALGCLEGTYSYISAVAVLKR